MPAAKLISVAGTRNSQILTLCKRLSALGAAMTLGWLCAPTGAPQSQVTLPGALSSQPTANRSKLVHASSHSVAPAATHTPIAAGNQATSALPAMDEPLQQRERADTLIGTLDRHVQELSHTAPELATESIVHAADHYLGGWLDAVDQVAPELWEPLGDSITAQLCTGSLSPAQQIILLRVVARHPIIASEQMFDCTLERQAGAEDLVTWQALDSWKASGLGDVAAIEALRDHATKPQTLARLAPKGELSSRDQYRTLERHTAAQAELKSLLNPPQTATAPPQTVAF